MGVKQSLVVLIVDDSRDIQRLLADSFKRDGHLPMTADSGEDALKILSSTPIDVVVTDLEMTKMGGLELVDSIRRQRPGLPVFLMSGAPLPEGIAKAGAIGVFRKPFSGGQLAKIVVSSLQKRNDEGEV